MSLFESEFNDDAVPTLAGDPAINSVLNAAVSGKPLGERVEMSQQTLIVDAVRSFYFAKEFRSGVRELGPNAPEELTMPAGVMCTDLMRLAVILVASVNDQQPRTKSLQNSVSYLIEGLEAVAGDDAQTARDRLAAIKIQIDPNKVAPLRYLRHMRNKWAGHASADREFDNWADARTGLSLPLIEKALTILINSHADVGAVLEASEAARGVAPSASRASTATDGAESFEMAIDWSAVIVLSELTRTVAKRSARRLVEQLLLSRTRET